MTGDDDNEIGEGADGEMNENAVVCCYLRVTATPTVFAINRGKCAVLHLRFARACSCAKIVVLTNAGSPILRVGKAEYSGMLCLKARETQECKSRSLLHDSRRGSDHTHEIQEWSDQRLTPVMQQ